MDSRARFGGVFTVLCHARDGLLKWQDTAKNLVVTTGLQYLLDTAFAGSAAATFYVGLVDDTPTFSAANTMSNRAGWTEFTEYTGNRQEYVDVRTNQTISNTASKASFPITGAGGGVGGAFLASMLRGHRPVVEQRAKVKQAERERERTGIGAWLKQVRARWAGRSKV